MLHKSKIFTASVLLCASCATVFAKTPAIIAHRGGTGDNPENTEYAINKSINNGANAVWVTLQLSKDNVIVLYRPSDLSTLTNLTGTVSSHTASELNHADAAYNWSPSDYPLRGKGITVPSLQEVLKKWPKTFFFLDIKSPDASPQTFASVLADTLQKSNGLGRVRVYSTDSRYLDALPTDIPRFESRDLTRSTLVNVAMNHDCKIASHKSAPVWYGFEYRREVQVTEKFTLGEGVSKSFLTWDREAFNCFKKDPRNKVILFGINTAEDYRQAKTLGADGVLVDSPEKFKSITGHRP